MPGPSRSRLVKATVSCCCANPACVVVVCTSPPVTCGSDTATPGVELKPVIDVPGKTPTFPTTVLVGTLVTVEEPSTAKLAKSLPKIGAAKANAGIKAIATRIGIAIFLIFTSFSLCSACRMGNATQEACRKKIVFYNKALQPDQRRHRSDCQILRLAMCA